MGTLTPVGESPKIIKPPTKSKVRVIKTEMLEKALKEEQERNNHERSDVL